RSEPAVSQECPEQRARVQDAFTALFAARRGREVPRELRDPRRRLGGGAGGSAIKQRHVCGRDCRAFDGATDSPWIAVRVPAWSRRVARGAAGARRRFGGRWKQSLRGEAVPQREDSVGNRMEARADSAGVAQSRVSVVGSRSGRRKI